MSITHEWEKKDKNFSTIFPEKKKQKKRKSDLANLGKQVLRCKDTLSKYLSLTCVMQICEKFKFYHLFHQMFDVYNMHYSYRIMQCSVQQVYLTSPLVQDIPAGLDHQQLPSRPKDYNRPLTSSTSLFRNWTLRGLHLYWKISLPFDFPSGISGIFGGMVHISEI